MTRWDSMFFKSVLATYEVHLCNNREPRWRSGNTPTSHLLDQSSNPGLTSSEKAGSYLPLVGSYSTEP